MEFCTVVGTEHISQRLDCQSCLGVGISGISNVHSVGHLCSQLLIYQLGKLLEPFPAILGEYRLSTQSTYIEKLSPMHCIFHSDPTLKVQHLVRWLLDIYLDSWIIAINRAQSNGALYINQHC